MLTCTTKNRLSNLLALKTEIARQGNKSAQRKIKSKSWTKCRDNTYMKLHTYKKKIEFYQPNVTFLASRCDIFGSICFQHQGGDKMAQKKPDLKNGQVQMLHQAITAL
uniref:Uncharacterized protein n=1 Tax=Cacopsylla melanoneura TaxID=428564 RepID=A0A8D8Z7S4_9HEMI